MTDKEKYKQAFSAIHASNKFDLRVVEVDRASKNGKINQIAAACVLLAGGSTRPQ